MSGYGLISDLNSVTGGARHPGSGSVYPLLDDLKARGLIAVASKGPRSKQVYAFTERGKKTFEEDRRMVNEFARKWNRLLRAVAELVSAENPSAFIIESARFNRVAWDRVIGSKELTQGQIEFALKKYKLLLDRELRWTSEQLRSLA